jgi:hypothetical protein
MIQVKWTTERKRRLFLHIIHGGTFRDIAKESDICTERARQIWNRMLRKLRRHGWDNNQPMPICTTTREHREHKDFWISMLNRVFIESGERS